jgi:uracil phosphoribosyltransferase
MPTVVVVDHPLVVHHMTVLRNATTPTAEFRRTIGRVATLVAYEATRDLPWETVEVTTPHATARGGRLRRGIALVPILRAGLGMVDALLELLPDVEVRHLGVYRDEATAEPVTYYNKLTEADNIDLALIVDPMLATGGSSLAALEALEACGVRHSKLITVISAPEGIQAVHARFPHTPIYTGALDPRLNDQKYITPGLGDAGDRMFGTGGI